MTPAPAEDRLLADRFLASRDEEAFRLLYRAQMPGLHRFLLNLCRNAGEAEELAQEAWVRAAASLGRFRWDSSLATWLRGIALNCWRETRRPRLVAGDDDLEDAPAPPFGAVERLDLARAVAELPDGYRAVLVLHDVEGHTHEEIGALLGIDAGTSKSQLARARRRLRARLAPGAPGKERG